MKGTLIKEEYGWVVRYKKQPNGPWFELSIYPDSRDLTESLEYFKEEKEEVDFEIIWGLNPYDGGNVCELAKITSTTKSKSHNKIKQTAIEFYKWMLIHNTPENTDQYFHYTDEDMFDEFYKETYGK
mgnify:CR=1 FL=1